MFVSMILWLHTYMNRRFYEYAVASCLVPEILMSLFPLACKDP